MSNQYKEELIKLLEELDDIDLIESGFDGEYWTNPRATEIIKILLEKVKSINEQ